MRTAEQEQRIRQLEFELEKAENGLAMPRDPDKIGWLRMLLAEAKRGQIPTPTNPATERT